MKINIKEIEYDFDVEWKKPDRKVDEISIDDLKSTIADETRDSKFRDIHEIIPNSIKLEDFITFATTRPQNYFVNGRVAVDFPYLQPDNIQLTIMHTCDMVCAISKTLHAFENSQLIMQLHFGDESGRFRTFSGLKRCKAELFGTKLCKWRSHLLFFGVSQNWPIYILFKPPPKRNNLPKNFNISEFIMEFLRFIFKAMRAKSDLDPEVRALIPPPEDLENVNAMNRLKISVNSKFITAFMDQVERIHPKDKYYCCFAAFRPGDKFELNPNTLKTFYSSVIGSFRRDLLMYLSIDLRTEFFPSSKFDTTPISAVINPSKMLPLVLSSGFKKVFEIEKCRLEAPYYLGNSLSFCNIQMIHSHGKFKFYDPSFSEVKNKLPFPKKTKNPMGIMVGMKAFVPSGTKNAYFDWAAKDISTKGQISPMFEHLSRKAGTVGTFAFETSVPIYSEEDFTRKFRFNSMVVNHIMQNKRSFFGFLKSEDKANFFKAQLSLVGFPFYELLQREQSKQFGRIGLKYNFASFERQLTAAGLMGNCTRIFQGVPNFFHKIVAQIVKVDHKKQENVFVPNYSLFYENDISLGLDSKEIPKEISDFSKDAIVRFAILNVFYSDKKSISEIWENYEKAIESNYIEEPKESCIGIGKKWLRNFIENCKLNDSNMNLVYSNDLISLEDSLHRLKWNQELFKDKVTTFGDVCVLYAQNRFSDKQAKCENWLSYAFSKLEKSKFPELLGAQLKILQKRLKLQVLEESKLFKINKHGDWEIGNSKNILSQVPELMVSFFSSPKNSRTRNISYELPESNYAKTEPIPKQTACPRLLLSEPGDSLFSAVLQAIFSITELKVRVQAEGKIIFIKILICS